MLALIDFVRMALSWTALSWMAPQSFGPFALDRHKDPRLNKLAFPKAAIEFTTSEWFETTYAGCFAVCVYWKFHHQHFNRVLFKVAVFVTTDSEHIRSNRFYRVCLLFVCCRHALAFVCPKFIKLTLNPFQQK